MFSMFLFLRCRVCAMHGRLFLVAVLACFCRAGEALVDGVPVTILTSVGRTVILPCRVSVNNHQIPSVEWSKEDLSSNPIVFLYRSGCETFEEKNPAFRYRTNLFLNELKNGNVSLRLSNAQLSDTGTFICKQNQNRGPPREVLRVKLFVGGVSEPRLSVVPAAADAGDDEVTLQCEAICWFLQPQVTFQDALGNVIGAENVRNDQDGQCFNVTQRATVKKSNRVTCRVHLPEINETRVTEIYIADNCMKSYSSVFTITAFIVIIMTLMASCAFNVYFYKKYSNSVGGHKLLQQQLSNGSGNSVENDLTNQADGLRNPSTEHLREIPELESIQHDKEEVVFTSNSPSTSSPHVSNPISSPQDKTPANSNQKPEASTSRNKPKPGTFPKAKDSKPAVPLQIQNGRHSQSSPALFSESSANASSPFPEETTRPARTMSMSKSRPHPNTSILQRRYTVSISSSNRFNVLADLPEEEREQLL